MKRGTALYGAALGATLMYLFDPDRGRYRRAIARDKAASGMSHLGDTTEVTLRDLRNRTVGLFAELGAWLREGPVPDDVLAARIRSQIGRVVSHPRAIEVTVNNGNATLSGRVLEHEYKDLCLCVRSMRGITRLEDRLTVHKASEHIPELQGGVPRQRRPDILQDHWAPATRLILGTTGGSLAINALRHGGPLNTALGLAGSMLFLRALTDKPRRRAPGLATGHGAVDIHKTLNLAVPVEEAYGFWTHYENLPQFMSNVREVTVREDGTSHWVVAGPAGMPVEWDAVTTRQVPNREIAWQTVPGSIVEHSGTVRFEPTPEGTRIDIAMSYNPPAGAVGHAIAKLFGADPKSEMDTDLMQMKTLIETGSTPRAAAAERQEALH
jgi:uncharacterized membrane protein